MSVVSSDPREMMKCVLDGSSFQLSTPSPEHIKTKLTLAMRVSSVNPIEWQNLGNLKPVPHFTTDTLS